MLEARDGGVDGSALSASEDVIIQIEDVQVILASHWSINAYYRLIGQYMMMIFRTKILSSLMAPTPPLSRREWPRELGSLRYRSVNKIHGETL